MFCFYLGPLKLSRASFAGVSHFHVPTADQWCTVLRSWLFLLNTCTVVTRLTHMDSKGNIYAGLKVILLPAELLPQSFRRFSKIDSYIYNAYAVLYVNIEGYKIINISRHFVFVLK
jgi:hypothetical protein